MPDDTTFCSSRGPYNENEGPERGEICGAPISASRPTDWVEFRFCYRYPGHAGPCMGWFDMWSDGGAGFEPPDPEDIADEQFNVSEYRYAVEKLGERQWWIYRYIPGRRRWDGAGEPLFRRRRDAIAEADWLNERARILAGLVHHSVPPYGYMNGQLRMDAEAALCRAEAAEAAPQPPSSTAD